MLKALKVCSAGLEIFFPGLKGPSSFLAPHAARSGGRASAEMNPVLLLAAVGQVSALALG